MLTVTYAECHIKAPFAERCYAECRYADCNGAQLWPEYRETFCLIKALPLYNKILVDMTRSGF